MTAFAPRVNSSQIYPAYELTLTDTNNVQWTLQMSAPNGATSEVNDSSALESALVALLSANGMQYQASLSKVVEDQSALYTSPAPPSIVDDVAGVLASAPDTQWATHSVTTGEVNYTGGTSSFTFNVELSSAPTWDVVVDISVNPQLVNYGSTALLALTSASSLTFTPANWNTPQAVTLEFTFNSQVTQYGSVTLSAQGCVSDVIYFQQ